MCKVSKECTCNGNCILHTNTKKLAFEAKDLAFKAKDRPRGKGHGLEDSISVHVLPVSVVRKASVIGEGWL